ncbi:hypothetical protein [Polaribacter sp. Asnod1-A03]
MKKLIFIAICILGIISFSSCRSTSSPCGLADNTTTTQTTLKQANFI